MPLGDQRDATVDAASLPAQLRERWNLASAAVDQQQPWRIRCAKGRRYIGPLTSSISMRRGYPVPVPGKASALEGLRVASTSSRRHVQEVA